MINPALCKIPDAETHIEVVFIIFPGNDSFYFAQDPRDYATLDPSNTFSSNGVADLEARIEKLPEITVPTITLEGDANGAPHYPDDSSYRKKFTGKYTNRVITGGIGHNLPQEAPAAFAQAIIDVDHF